MLDPEQVRAPRVPKRNRLSLAIVAWLFPGPLAAAPLYNAPTGLWLAPSNHAVTLYGPTMAEANWNVAQWNIPDDLPPFNAVGVSQNRWARVAWLGAGRYELAQDASALSCDKLYPSGRQLVTEFDLLASPNNRRFPGFPQATAPTGPDLARASQIKADIDLEVRNAKAADTICKVTQTIFTLAVVLTNTTRRQTIFYQVRLGFVRPMASSAEAHPPEPAWFFTGTNIQAGGTGQFGFGDNVLPLGNPGPSRDSRRCPISTCSHGCAGS